LTGKGRLIPLFQPTLWRGKWDIGLTCQAIGMIPRPLGRFLLMGSVRQLTDEV